MWIYKLSLMFLLLFLILLLPGSGQVELTELARETEAIDWTISLKFEDEGHEFLGKQGVIGLSDLSKNSNRFFSNDKEMFVWRIYGDPKEFEQDLNGFTLQNNNKEVQILALHKETNSKTNLLKGKDEIHFRPFYQSVKKGIQLQTVMSFPKAGIWSVGVYIKGDLIGRVNVDVRESGTFSRS